MTEEIQPTQTFDTICVGGPKVHAFIFDNIKDPEFALTVDHWLHAILVDVDQRGIAKRPDVGRAMSLNRKTGLKMEDGEDVHSAYQVNVLIGYTDALVDGVVRNDLIYGYRFYLIHNEQGEITDMSFPTVFDNVTKTETPFTPMVPKSTADAISAAIDALGPDLRNL